MKGKIISDVNKKYYVFQAQSGHIIRTLKDDKFIAEMNLPFAGMGGCILSYDWYIHCVNETGYVYIYNLSSGDNKAVNIFKLLTIPLETERGFRFCHLKGNILVLNAGSYILLLDCETGNILDSYEFMAWGMRSNNFIVKEDFLYYEITTQLIKLDFRGNKFKEIYKNNNVPKLENGFYNHDLFHRDFQVSGNSIWALNGITEKVPKLFQFSEVTGELLKITDLSDYGIKEARYLTVTNDNIYISGENNKAWVFDKEKEEY